MTKKIRLVRIQVLEYEPDPLYYTEGSTIEEMAEVDFSNIDIYFDEDIVGDGYSQEVGYEIVESEN